MTVLFQNSFYIGNTFNGILYGVELMLCLLTAEAMAKKRRAHRARSDLLLMTFNGASLLLNTIYVATEAVFGQEMWIEKASYSGGQDAYLRDHESVWYQTLGTSASIVLNLLSDALMIHRCNVIWGDVRAIIGPCILYLATLCLGVAQLVESGLPHSRYFSGVGHTLGVSYTITVIALELIVTTLICTRILQVRQWHRAAWAAPQTGASIALSASTSTSTSTSTSPPTPSSSSRSHWVRTVAGSYTGAVAIVAESSLLSTLCGVAYLVTYALESDVAVFFLSIYVMSAVSVPAFNLLRVAVCGSRSGGWQLTITFFLFLFFLCPSSAQCISPQLIVLRVMRGQAWTRRTTATIVTGTGAPGGDGDVYFPNTRMGVLSSAFTVGSESATTSHFCKECEGRYLHGRVAGPGMA